MPELGFTTEMQLTRGEVWIPALSVLVARLEKPRLLRRREDADPELGRYDLHAAYSYFNRDLWDDPEFDKEIRLFLGKRPMTVVLYPKTVVVFMQGAIRMEGVTWQEA